MKIAIIAPGGFDHSAEQRVIPVLLWLLERLARDHDIRVFTLEQYADPQYYRLLGAQVMSLGHVNKTIPGLKNIVQVKRVLDAFRANAWMPDILHAFWASDSGLVAGIVGLLIHRPVVVSLLGNELVSLPNIQYGAQLRFLSRLKVGLAIRLARQSTAATQYMIALAEKRYGITPLYLPLGVDDRQFHAQKEIRSGPPWRLLQVADLNQVKNQPMLLRALRRVIQREPNTHLDIIGFDTLNGKIQQLANDLSLEKHIKFHGFLPNAQVQQFFQSADLFVLTSWHEAGAVALLEAAACGLPAIGTRVGLIPEWADSQTALSVSVDDDQALADGIITLLHNPTLRQNMGLRAQSWAHQYSADWTKIQLESLYAKLTRDS